MAQGYGRDRGYSVQAEVSKADEIRRLLGEGKTRSETARLAGTTYQQVYQVDKKRGTRSVSVPHRSPSYGYGYGGSNRQHDHARADFPDSKLPVRGTKAHPIRTGPLQVRVATQDGHEVRLSDDVSGKVCFNCKRSIQYSIRELAYVHTMSREPVTSSVDMQSGPGLFDG
jgi:hypothetical protein